MTAALLGPFLRFRAVGGVEFPGVAVHLSADDQQGQDEDSRFEQPVNGVWKIGIAGCILVAGIGWVKMMSVHLFISLMTNN